MPSCELIADSSTTPDKAAVIATVTFDAASPGGRKSVVYMIGIISPIGNLVEIDAGIDDLLAAHVPALRNLDRGVGRQCLERWPRDRDELQRCGLEAAALESPNADRLLAAAIGLEPDRPEQPREPPRRSAERGQELEHFRPPRSDIAPRHGLGRLAHSRHRQPARIICLHEHSAVARLILSVPLPEAVDELQCLRIGTVEHHRRSSEQGMREEIRLALLLRLATERCGEGSVRDIGAAQDRLREALPA